MANHRLCQSILLVSLASSAVLGSMNLTGCGRKEEAPPPKAKPGAKDKDAGQGLKEASCTAADCPSYPIFIDAQGLVGNQLIGIPEKKVSWAFTGRIEQALDREISVYVGAPKQGKAIGQNSNSVVVDYTASSATDSGKIKAKARDMSRCTTLEEDKEVCNDLKQSLKEYDVDKTFEYITKGLPEKPQDLNPIGPGLPTAGAGANPVGQAGGRGGLLGGGGGGIGGILKQCGGGLFQGLMGAMRGGRMNFGNLSNLFGGCLGGLFK